MSVFVKLIEKGLEVEDIWYFPDEGEVMIQLKVASALFGSVL